MEIAPVVLVLFNRPKETREVFKKVRQARVPKLYIIMDAPRNGNETDIKLNEEVKEIVQNVDWECQVKWNIAKENMGVGPRPYTGIDWVFQHEDRAIILEDDCVPALAFFDFASELLERYKDDHRIMHISGTRYNQEFVSNNDSYLFSRYQYNWGWATWRRAWKCYDYDLSNYNEVKRKKYFENRFSNSEATHWQGKFDRAQEQKARMWDYQWQYAVFMNSGLCIFPKENLICNIGPFGTTAPNFNASLYYRDIDESFQIKEHPTVVCVNEAFDQYYFNKHIFVQLSIFQRIIRKIKRLIIPKKIIQKRIYIDLKEKENKFYLNN